MVPLCCHIGVGVIPWSPLARGLLAGTRHRSGEPRTARAASDDYARQLYSADDFDTRRRGPGRRCRSRRAAGQRRARLAAAHPPPSPPPSSAPPHPTTSTRPRAPSPSSSPTSRWTACRRRTGHARFADTRKAKTTLATAVKITICRVISLPTRRGGVRLDRTGLHCFVADAYGCDSARRYLHGSIRFRFTPRRSDDSFPILVGGLEWWANAGSRRGTRC